MSAQREKGQLNVRVSGAAFRILAALQRHFASRAGLIEPLTQAQTIEIALRETAAREGLKVKGVAR